MTQADLSANPVTLAHLYYYILNRKKHYLLNISRGTSHFFQSTVQLIYTMFDKLFIFVFVLNYPISWQSLIDIIFGYLLIGQFDII